ncbi:hypothetical protein [Rhizobium tibeticum]|nr:hypothetical protein [Rhizobium tibeticum]
MSNGRCAYHGGRTPKGDEWHKPRWPNGDASNAEKRLQRKLRDLERAKRKRDARLARMTPEERDRSAAKSRAARPRPAKERAADRAARKEAAKTRALLAEERPRDPALVEIDRQIAELERRAASLLFDIFD